MFEHTRSGARSRALLRSLAAVAALALTAAAAPAVAQTAAPIKPCVCAPFQNDDEQFAMILSHNLIGGPGPWLAWACYAQKIPEGSTQAPRPRYCAMAAPWSAIDLRRLGDRFDTIRASPDPVKAFEAGWRRHVTVDLATAASLRPLREAILNDFRRSNELARAAAARR